MSKTQAAMVLGIEVDASVDEAKKAYRSAMLVVHPDKGGTEEQTDWVTKAFEQFCGSAPKLARTHI